MLATARGEPGRVGNSSNARGSRGLKDVWFHQTHCGKYFDVFSSGTTFVGVAFAFSLKLVREPMPLAFTQQQALCVMLLA